MVHILVLKVMISSFVVNGLRLVAQVPENASPNFGRIEILDDSSDDFFPLLGDLIDSKITSRMEFEEGARRGRGETKEISEDKYFVLFLGCSLDRMMVNYCAESECRKKGFHFVNVFIPGVSPPYFNKFERRALKNTTFKIVSAAATIYDHASMVVVSSDLWDLAAWWQQAKSPRTPYTYTTHFDRWANTDIPALLHHVKQQFPQSRIVFRSAPTTRENTRYGASPELMEQMYARTAAKVIDGKILGEFEFFDYHIIVDELIRDKGLGMVFQDAIHPGSVGQEAYMKGIFDMVQTSISS